MPASLALHLLVLALILPGLDSPPAPEPTRHEVQLVLVEPLEAARELAVPSPSVPARRQTTRPIEPAPRSPAPDEERPVAPVARPAADRPAAPAPAPEATSAVAPPADGATPAADAAPLEAGATPEDAAVLRLALPLDGPRKLDLTVRLPEATGGDEAAGRAADATAWAAERLDGYLRQLIAESRVQGGAVDPGWSALARRAERHWTPSFSHVQEAAVTEVSGAWLAKLARDWWDDYLEGAAQYGARGRNTPDEDDVRHEMPALANLELNRAAYGGEGYGDLITAIVEVRIGTAGDTSSRLFRSSGYTTYDQAVLAAVSEALQAPEPADLPPGPARALYAMAAQYIILPPLPAAGLSFDLALGHLDPMYPLKKIVRGQARLISVERLDAAGGETAGDAAGEATSRPAP